MHSFPFYTITFWLGVAVETAIIWALFHRRLWRSWRSIGLYCFFDFAFDIALMVNQAAYKHNAHLQYKHYFYIYWSSVAVSTLMRLWVLSDVLDSFPGVAFLRKELRWIVGIAGTVMAAGCWLIAFHGIKILAGKIPQAVISLNQCVAVSWGGFYVAALVGIVVFHLAWSRRGAAIANGLLLTTAAGVLVSHLFTGSGASRTTGSYVLSATSLVTIAMWLAAISRPEEVYAASPEVLSAFASGSGRLKTT